MQAARGTVLHAGVPTCLARRAGARTLQMSAGWWSCPCALILTSARTLQWLFAMHRLFLFFAASLLSAQSFDLVVYGGTAGGAITAVSGAREGLKVVLLEPGRHIGGMVSGGLSRTDVGKKEVIGGYALEFYWRAGKAYEIS